MPLFNRKSTKKMPLFRSQTEEKKKRLQHQLYLAQENPEPHFDISECQLSSIPSSVYSSCKILNKEVLLLYDNWISDIEAHGKLCDLFSLRVLDLHKNEIKSIPDSISELQNLQVLNLEENRLKKLPDKIGDLVNLQTLNVKNNIIQQIPSSLCKLTRLRTLDISRNEISNLPSQMCHIRTMETLILDPAQMSHPSSGVCDKGTEEIMKSLCKECGIEYQPPSNFVLDVLDTPKPMTSSWSNNSFKMRRDEVKLMETVEQYQSQVDKKHKERLELEKQLYDDQNAFDELASKVSINKQNLVDSLAKDQEKLDHDLSEISHRRDVERSKLLSEIVEVEKNTDHLISQLIDFNEKAKKTEHLLESVEKERRENDDWFVVRWEEIQNLRTKEVLNAMESMIMDNAQFEISRQTFTSDREHAVKSVLVEETKLSDHQVEEILQSKDKGHKVLKDTLSQQQRLQKHAFEVLQLQKDKKHQRITNSIGLIEEHLAELTKIERDKREERAEIEMNILCEKRIALCGMLSQLMEEQDHRQKELQKRVLEMEEQQLDGQADYWMVQYQRLMDSKPQRLIDQERNLEISVVKILQKAGAEDYLPLFARQRITIETMLQLSEDDMKQMGVHELGLRRSISNYIDDYKQSNTKSKSFNFDDQDTKESNIATSSTPSAPDVAEVPVTPNEGLTALRRQQSFTAHGIHSECAVCLDKESQILFLNCGHVCCCSECAEPLTECPLCRGNIVQRIRLHLAG